MSQIMEERDQTDGSGAYELNQRATNRYGLSDHGRRARLRLLLEAGSPPGHRSALRSTRFNTDPDDSSQPHQSVPPFLSACSTWCMSTVLCTLPLLVGETTGATSRI